MQKPEWRKGSEFARDAAVLEDVAAGVHEAGNPFYDQMFGGADAARAVLRDWVRRPSSEVYVGRSRLLFEGSVLAGGYIAMSGAECKASRMADGLALLALAKGPARRELLARVEGFKGGFAALEDDDWYVSKMWVRPEFRGKARGYALTVSRAVLEEPAPGLRKIAEAAASNAPALKIYERMGCAVVQRNKAANGYEFLVFRLRDDASAAARRPPRPEGAEPGRAGGDAADGGRPVVDRALVWRSGEDYLNDEAMLDGMADGVLEAGNPYYEYLFGGVAEAQAALREWVRRPTSEVYAARAQLLFDRGALVGGVIGMPGTECRGCRLADVAALHAFARGASRAGLVERMEKLKGLFAPVEKDDWYASKLWVLPHLRGKGYALPLARAAFFPETPPRGRSLGDVAAGNGPALHIYTKHLGCTIARRKRSPSGLEYVVVVAPRAPVTARGPDRPR